MPFSLILSQYAYSREELLLREKFPDTSAYERAVLEFVQQWLRGQEEFVVHTSGSTGAPKPIYLHRKHMQVSAQLTLDALGIAAGTPAAGKPAAGAPAAGFPALLCMHPRFIGGKMMLVRAMEAHLSLIALEPAANPLKNFSASPFPLFTAMVPLQLQAIMQDVESLALLNQMQAVLIGGAAITPSLEAAAQAVVAPLYSTYGMTETVSHIALRRINGPERKEHFTALPQVSLSTDARGCLVIESPVSEVPVVTNDVVEMIGQGKFRWLGRADNIINSGGVKVQAERVEEVTAQGLQQLDLSRRALVAGLPNELLGNKVTLLLEGQRLKESQEQQLLLYLQQHLPRYWAPKDILYLLKFVESDNGKIKRKETLLQLGY